MVQMSLSRVFLWLLALQVILCSVYLIFIRGASFRLPRALGNLIGPDRGTTLSRFATASSPADNVARDMIVTGKSDNASTSVTQKMSLATKIPEPDAGPGDDKTPKGASPVKAKSPEKANRTKEKEDSILFTTEDRIPSTFQPIDNEDAWVYSAFFDHVSAQQGNPLVRAQAVIKKKVIRSVSCHFFNKGENFTSKGTIRIYPDQHGRAFVTSRIDCSLANGTMPKYVSFTLNSTKPTNQLPVLYPAPRSRNFTVCYAALHSKYSRTSQLIQSIEINRILGANHFMVYNCSVTPQVSQVFEHYQSEGLLTVHQWALPNVDAWYFAQMTAINDCIFRNRNTSEFVVIVDTDEIIVPRKHQSWMELIDSFEMQQKPGNVTHAGLSPKNTTRAFQAACFLFRSSRFGRNSSKDLEKITKQFSLTPDEQTFVRKYGMQMLAEVWHSEVNPVRHRSKYIIRPDLVEIGQIHHPNKFSRKVEVPEVIVSEDLALVHHHRYGREFKTFQDTDILRFKSTLFKSLSERCKKLPKLFPPLNKRR